jgi:hypothetical protein
VAQQPPDVICGGTARERFATILLPNSVAREDTGQHRPVRGLAERQTNRAHLTQSGLDKTAIPEVSHRPGDAMVRIAVPHS